MTKNEIRQGFGALVDSLTDGWHRLRETTAGALTRFRAGEADKPASTAGTAPPDTGGAGWALIGGDVFEDARRIVVRLEVPGMAKQDFEVEVSGQTLSVRGEKRFEAEHSEGRWRVQQCAYGRFERQVGLPAAVRGEDASASYRDGVLRIELPKAESAPPRAVRITPA